MRNMTQKIIRIVEHLISKKWSVLSNQFKMASPKQAPLELRINNNALQYSNLNPKLSMIHASEKRIFRVFRFFLVNFSAQ